MYPGNTKKQEVTVHLNSAPDCTEYTNSECSERHHVIETSHYEGRRQIKLRAQNDTCTEGTWNQVPTNYVGKILEE